MTFLSRLRSKTNSSVKLFILGAQKCGTTSLHYYLNQHPDLIGSHPKETDFFSYDSYYQRGLPSYHECFKETKRPGAALKFEASTEYLYIPCCAERIKAYNRSAKFIVLKRHPIERALSAYKMYKALSEDRLWADAYLKRIQNHNSYLKSRMIDVLSLRPFPSFKDLVNREYALLMKSDDSFIYEPSLIARGNYSLQLKRYYDLFPSDNILEIDFIEFAQATNDVLDKILKFLDISNSPFHHTLDYSVQLQSKERIVGEDDLVSEQLSSIFDEVYTKFK